MLTTPIFRPWRPLWDTQIGDLTRQLDELARQRQKGRQVPPSVHDWSDVQSILIALHYSHGRVSSLEFFEQKITPLLKACVWPRWLLLEEALDYAANSGDLHMSALILRTQIEELDALRTVAELLSCREEGSWDRDTKACVIRTLTTRILPRIQTKTEDQLLQQASDVSIATSRPVTLQRSFDRLSEYVHPNYGSHILSVRPHDIEAAKVIVDAFVAVYDAFLSLPWSKDSGNGREESTHSGKTAPLDPYLILANDTIPKLRPALKAVGEDTLDDAIECFRQCAACEENWAALEYLPTEVEAIKALVANSVPSDSWPDALKTVSGKNRYAFLVAQEQRLSQDVTHLVAGTGTSDERTRLSVLVSGLSFSINMTEHKLDSLARQAARLINADNVLGATVAVRSMLEHHAIAIELGEKVQALWERAEKLAPNESKVANAFAEAEKQLARVLAGSSEPSGSQSAWRDLWLESVRKPYNVLGPIKAMDSKQPGFLKTYGLLSHIMHGTVCTGGDLIGMGGQDWRAGHRVIAAQLAQFLANLCKFDATLDRQTASMTLAYRLDVLRRKTDLPGDQIKAMRILEGQKLKNGRDVFGSGTSSDPFRFRDGLIYHDSFSHYLKQQGIRVRNRMAQRFEAGFGDRVEAEDGRILYFLNDKMHVEEAQIR